MAFTHKSKLPRLPREYYRGHAVVFWTHTFENRATGWLSEKFHAHFRETLLHACGRYGLLCPIYVLMPDHWHLVWMGFTAESDQHSATKFLRKNLVPHIAPAKLQDRAHDSVLREEKRKRGAFAAACEYIRENPVRAGLIARWQDWRYLGAMGCGYPEFDPHDEDFWDDFWKIYNRLVVANENPGSPEPGYQFPTAG